MGHYNEAFGAAAPEAYVPHMVDQGRALEEDHGPFLGPGWGEETPEAELFQEPGKASSTTLEAATSGYF